MSSKKILAASLAAMLAVSSASVMAFADDAVASAWPANDEFNWTISGKDAGEDGTWTLNLKTEAGSTISTCAGTLKEVTGSGAGDFKASKIGVGLWEAWADFDIVGMKNAKAEVTVKAKANYTTVPYVTAEFDTTKYELKDTYGSVPALVGKDGKKITAGLKVTESSGTTTAGKVEVVFIDEHGDVIPALSVANNATASTGATAMFPGYADNTGEAAWEDFANGVIYQVNDTDAGGNYVQLTKANMSTALSRLTASLNKISQSKALEGEGANADATTGGLAVKEVTATSSVAMTDNWRNTSTMPNTTTANWDATDGKTTGPNIVETKFSLGTGETLAKKVVDWNWNNGTWEGLADLKWTVTADLEVSDATYQKYIKDKYSVIGNEQYPWIGNGSTPTVTGWGTSQVTFVNGTKNGLAFLTEAYNGSSFETGTIEAIAIRDTVTKDPEYTSVKKDLFVADTGRAGINFAQIVPPNVMKNLNNGGTVTFYFNKAMDWSAYKTGVLQYWNSNNRIVLNAQSGYSISDDKITFEIPAGLSWDDALNAYKPFNLDWDFRNNMQADDYNTIFEDEKPVIADYDGKIVAISFHANGAAVSDDDNSNNSGSNSGSNGGGSTTNPGNTGNPNTGIALAVAPVVLAAGAVATVVAKKRK